MKRTLSLLILLIGGLFISRLQAQTASFNFSLASQAVTGWNNVHGDPSTGVRTGTDATTGISISSVNMANWVPLSGTGSAYDGLGASGGTYFPSSVLLNHWFQFSSLAAYNGALPQLEISGLNVDSVYTIKMAGSSTSTYISNPTQYSVAGSTIYGYIGVNNHNNTASGASFNNISPDAGGKIRVFVNTVTGTDVADISGIQITRGHTSPPPIVTLTNPLNHAVLAEDGNFGITATASETSGSIAKVEFFIDTSKIGEATSAPYSVTWINPDAGSYTITATAVDNSGVSNSSSIQVSIESLSSFWSTTGNIHMNPDSNFVGNVDSLRLGFRTKNIERMSISPLGNVGIGTTSPTAQLHTTGTVRHAGLANDSTKTRVLVTDTSGNVYYRNVTSLGALDHWTFASGTTYDSADNIGIGTSNTQGYKLAVNGTAIFTKVKVKTAGTWPDYVFNKQYALPSLEEVERYITQHQHLPGIDPASVIETQGIDVGAQQAAQLKKMEELTLYLIEENKQLKEQNIELKKLQAEIDVLRLLIQSKK